jgi:hypothetical protein
MKISLIDRSMYFKGLLLLIRKDRQIHQKERDMIMRISSILGFEENFCKNAITEILDNKYISDETPSFSNPDITKCFIKDGLRLALVDAKFHGKEVAWLKVIAEQHGLEDTWYEHALKNILDHLLGEPIDGLEAAHLEWE